MDQFMEDQTAVQNYRAIKAELESGNIDLAEAILNFKAEIQ